VPLDFRSALEIFAGFAKDGKTVVCVTHTLNEIDVCDHVMVLHRGMLVYFGPPGALAQYFRLKRVVDVYATIEALQPERLAERYKRSDLHSEFVANRMQQSAISSRRSQPC